MNLNTDEKLVFTTDDQWSLFVGETDILTNLQWHKGYSDGRQVWQALTPIGGGLWLRLRAMAEPGSSLVVFWAWPVAGDTSVSVPRLGLREVRITSTPGLSPLVDYTVAGESWLRDDPENEGFTIGGLLHGQGTTLRSFHVDFGQQVWGGDDGVFAENRYVPRAPNKTGGNWAYMGLSYPVESIKITDIYAMGGYGGFFQNTDGSWVTEKQFPNLQASSHIHEHSNDKGWINYTDPRNTWRDRMSVFKNNPDGQHLCQISVLAQLAEFYPKDEGLKMLLEAWSHVYTRQFPAKARGTSHANSGQERAQGRVMKSGVDAFMATVNLDDDTAMRFGRRVLDRWNNDRVQFLKYHTENGLGFSPFAEGGYATNEIGIHYWGLWRLHQALEKLGVAHLEEFHYWMREATRWCFESWRFYDIQGDRHWGYPYFEDKDHEAMHGPVSGEHFGWLAATHYHPQNPTEEAKHKAIVELGAGMDPRFVR